MTKCGIFFSTQELRTVYDQFDLNKDGVICYNDLISVLRNNISDSRLEAIKKAYVHVSDGAPSVSFDALQKQFKGNCHPRVQSREKTVQQVNSEFCDMMGRYCKDGQITEEGFINFYLDFNSVLPQEKETYFHQVLTQTWGLNTATTPAVAGGKSQYVPTARMN